jgi:hypothetical protein
MTLSSKQCLQKHLSKKKGCLANETASETDRTVLLEQLNEKAVSTKQTTFTCEDCNKVFTSRQAKYLHKKSFCKAKTSPTTLDAQLPSRSDGCEITVSPTTLDASSGWQCGNRISQSTLPSSINNFGNENINHLSNEFLSHCLLACNTGIKNLMKEIHFNPQFPENHNIRVYSRKGKILEKYTDGGWHVCDQNNTLDEMIRRGYRILFKHLAYINEQYMVEKSDDDDDKIIIRNENANNYLTKLIRKENIYFELRRDLYMMILDGSLQR